MATPKKSFFFFGAPPETISPMAAPPPPGLQFEFDESDVVWGNDDFNRASPGGARRPSASSIPSSRRPVVVSKRPKGDDRPASLPVCVPEWREGGGEDGGGGERGAAVVPPHEYLARRRGASMSVHEGIGRTLKGRDLSRVRNAIWKQIGFED